MFSSSSLWSGAGIIGRSSTGVHNSVTTEENLPST